MQTGRIQTTRHVTTRSEWRRRSGGGASDVGSSASDDGSDAPSVRAMPPHQSFVVALNPFVFVREERSAASKQLGYKSKQGFVIYRVRVKRGSRKNRQSRRRRRPSTPKPLGRRNDSRHQHRGR